MEENLDLLSVVLEGTSLDESDENGISNSSEDNKAVVPTKEDIIAQFPEDMQRVIEVQQARALEEQKKKELALKLAKEQSGNSKQNVSYGNFTSSNPRKVVIENNKRNKYLIVPDLHIWYKNISCRKDYLGELEEALNNIMMYINGDRTINNVILAGDIYHRGFNDLDSSRPIKKYWSNLKYVLNSRGGELYAVIGNHEFSFSKNNPFWLQDDVLFKTPEDIIDNGVHFYLESYHCQKSVRDLRESVDCDICITHNEVLPPEMVDFVRKESGRRVFTSKKCTSFERYRVKHLFVGHMHQVVDTFIVNDNDMNFEVQYLGSIGRTSVEEISNEFRERSLPVVEVGIDKDGNEGSGKFNVTQLPLMLREYHETVISEQVEKNRKIRDTQKDLKELKLQKVTDDPVEELKQSMNNELVSGIIDAASENRGYVPLVKLISDLNALIS